MEDNAQNTYHQPHSVVMLSEASRQEEFEGNRHSLANSLSKLLNEVNSALSPFEQLAFIAITKDVWNAENGFLTPTLKIKRKVLDATYGLLAEKWYKMKQPVVWEAAG